MSRNRPDKVAKYFQIVNIKYLLSEKRLENSNYISDRCTMDCFAVIKMRMTKEDLDAFTERHKVSQPAGDSAVIFNILSL